MSETDDHELLISLRAVLGDAFPISDILGMAIEMVKLGMTPTDAEQAMRAHFLMKSLDVSADEIRETGFKKWRGEEQ